MAFDMYADDAHECIGHHEEFIFTLADENEERYPLIVALGWALYDGPRLSAQQAGGLVHELIELLVAHGGIGNRPLAALVVRLLSFFSNAYRKGLDIRCVSD